MTPRKTSRSPVHFRDLFLGALALVILYDQVFIAPTAQAILIFLVIFLLGSIPALRGDSASGKPSIFARFIMTMLGVEFPSAWTDEDAPDGTSSSDDTPTPSGGSSPAGSGRSSSGSSPSSHTKDDP